MDDSEPKWVNSVLDIIGVYSLKHGDLQIKLANLRNTMIVLSPKI